MTLFVESLSSIVSRSRSSRRRGRHVRQRGAFVVSSGFESLEDRTLLSANLYTVNVLTDSSGSSGGAGAGTTGDLRYCIAQADLAANAGSTIQFSVTGTITLDGTLGGLTLSQNTTINGPGASSLTVAGTAASGFGSVFTVSSGVTASISGLTISSGYATNGGGIDNNGTLTLTNDTLSANSASNYGGGIYNGGHLVLANDTLSGNSAVNGGGVFNGNTVTLANGTLSTNHASYGGGGIYNNGIMTLTNGTLSGNSAGNPGGGIMNAGTLTLTNDTLSGNSANYGGGIYNSSTLNPGNTLVAGNTATAAGFDVYGTFTSQGNNLVGKTDGSSGWVSSDLTGTVALPLNPGLGALANNGGPTQTMALLAGSPALDAGSATLSGVPTTDQRGALRGVVGLNAGANPDIGAYEASSSYLVTSTADTTDVGTLRAAVGWANASTNANAANSPVATNTIQFSVTGTISLASALGGLTLSQNVTIDGPGASSLTVAGTGASGFGSVFTVNSGVTAVISGVSIRSGYAINGGGIYNNGTLTLTDATLSANAATNNGGGIFNNEFSVATLTNDTLSGNSATSGSGGGIFNNAYGVATLTNDTLSGNSATNFGGGIFNDSYGGVTLTNDTLSGNSASYVGGVYNYAGTVTPGNTIVAGNTATTADPDIYGAFASQGHNLIGKTDGSSGWVGSDLTGTVASPLDPKLGALANNGGPTQTMALLAGSPALDAGSATLSGAPTADQRGAQRGVLGLNAGANPDIGAYEASSSYLVSLTTDTTDIGTLRAAVGWANVSTNVNSANIPLAANTIQFGVTGTISLSSALGGLTLSQKVAIDGPGASSLTVAGTGASGFGSVFTINVGATVAISGLTISGGNTSGNGGGVNNSGTSTLTGDTVTGNSAYNGGGIYNGTGTLTVTNVSVSGNSAVQGGGIFEDVGKLTLTGDTLSGNSASSFGGGINNYGGNVTVTDVTVSGNSAVDGGGIYNFFRGTLTLINDTVSGNSAYQGGGVFNYSGGTATPGNTLIAANTSTGTGPDVYASFASMGHNLIGKTDGSSGWVSSDLTGTVASPLNPLLGTLASNGGPTQTIALLPGSPAIDAGSTTVTNYPAADQRGISRVGAPDIGAFESRGFTITIGGGDGQSATVNTAFAQPLKVTVASAFGEPVAGGVVTFTAPGSGASATLTGSRATIAADGTASVTATANGTAGSYTVTAAAAGTASPGDFSLTNTNPVVIEQADLGVTNDATPAPVIAGNELTYTVVVTNYGPNDAQNAALSFPLPVGTTLGAAVSLPSGWTETDTVGVGGSGTLAFTIPALAANASSTFTIVAQVASSVADGTTLTTTATVNTTTAEPSPDTTHPDSAQNTTNVIAQADLSITNAGPPTAVAGDSSGFDYTFVVTNNGPSDNSGGFTVTDVLPAGLTFVSTGSTTGASAVGQTVTFTNNTGLASGATQTIHLHVTLGASATGNLSDSASVASQGTTDPGSSNNVSNTVATTVLVQNDVSVTNVDNLGGSSVTPNTGTVVPGRTLVYTVTVSNSGPSTATNVAVSEPLPSGVDSFTWSGNGHAGVSGALSDTIASLAPGSSVVYTITAAVDASSTGTLSATATVSGSNDTNGSNNSATDTDNLTPQNDVSVTNVDNVGGSSVTGSVGAVVAGTSFTYTITVGNNGPSTATNVSVSDPLPAGVTSFVWSGDNRSGVSGPLSDTIASLAPGASVVYTVTATVSPSALGQLSNTATVTAANDVNANNNTATVKTTVQTQADLGVSNNGTPNPVIAGNDLTYTVVVSNYGPSDAQNTTLSYPLPSGTTLGAAVVVPGGWTETDAVAVGTGGTLMFHANALASGASTTFTIVAHVASSVAGGATLTSTAAVHTDTAEPSPDTTHPDSAASTTGVVARADLSVTNAGPSSALAGDPSGFDYTIVVTNNGPSDNAGGFTVTDVLPSDLTFQSVGSTSGASASGQSVTFSTTSGLASGASETITLHVTLSGSAGQGSVLSDSASVSSDGTTDPNSGNDTSNTVSTTVTSATQTLADLAVHVSAAAATLAGTDLTYTVTVTNNGPDDAQSVSVSGLAIPANTAFVSYTGAPGWSSTPVPAVGATSGSITATIGTLAAGASGTFTFKVQVNGFTPGGTPISLTATASTSTTDPTPDDSNNVATSTSTVTLTGAGLATNLANPSQVDLVGDGNTVAFATVGSQVGVVIDGHYDGAFSPTGRLVAYGRGANDRITVSSTITLPATLYGSGGGDTLVAGGGNSVLVGGGGSVTLVSGAGHNILISGAGSVGASKVLNGMAGSNIMIGGSTDWDHNDQALGSLLAEWGRTDLPPSTSYATRVSDLLNGGGLNGSFTLNSTTVHDNGVRDTLIGGGTGQNWYLAHVSGAGVLDIIIGKKNTETVTAI